MFPAEGGETDVKSFRFELKECKHIYMYGHSNICCMYI